MKKDSDERGRERAQKVKAAMIHAWDGYKQYAWGADELAPRGKRSKQSWGNMGVTLVDSLGNKHRYSGGGRRGGRSSSSRVVAVVVRRARAAHSFVGQS